jgi:hypothetical protein
MPNFMPNKYHHTLGMINGKFEEREIMESMCQIMNGLGTKVVTLVRHLNHFP